MAISIRFGIFIPFVCFCGVLACSGEEDTDSLLAEARTACENWCNLEGCAGDVRLDGVCSCDDFSGSSSESDVCLASVADWFDCSRSVQCDAFSEQSIDVVNTCGTLTTEVNTECSQTSVTFDTPSSTDEQRLFAACDSYCRKAQSCQNASEDQRCATASGCLVQTTTNDVSDTCKLALTRVYECFQPLSCEAAFDSTTPADCDTEFQAASIACSTAANSFNVLSIPF